MQLERMLEANGADVVRMIEKTPDEDSGLSLEKEAAELRERIYTCLAKFVKGDIFLRAFAVVQE